MNIGLMFYSIYYNVVIFVIMVALTRVLYLNYVALSIPVGFYKLEEIEIQDLVY